VPIALLSIFFLNASGVVLTVLFKSSIPLFIFDYHFVLIIKKVRLELSLIIVDLCPQFNAASSCFMHFSFLLAYIHFTKGFCCDVSVYILCAFTSLFMHFEGPL
jgi:hypothetical protein